MTEPLPRLLTAWHYSPCDGIPDCIAFSLVPEYRDHDRHLRRSSLLQGSQDYFDAEVMNTAVAPAEYKIRVRKPILDTLSIAPTSQELSQYVCAKYGVPMAPSPSLRSSLGFASADDTYETLVSKLVREGARWLDVGCGRDLFPTNYEQAKMLADRASVLVGVDPDENVHENDLLSERFQGQIEDYQTSEQFDLITMRMVAEHVTDPVRCVRKLAALTGPGGLVVIYTPSKWAPMSIAASIVPFAFHNTLKRAIWDTEERDTFPTAYRMNTRGALRRLFMDADFQEAYFSRVDDCSVLTKWLLLNRLEISLRNLMFGLGLRYPEACLLAVFQRKVG